MIRVTTPEKPRSRLTDATGIDNAYLIFSLSEQDYAVPVGQIREIIGVMMLVNKPGTKLDYIKGLVRLSGRVIPVIDLRSKFGLEPAECTNMSGIVVVDFVTGTGEPMEVGAVVDRVWGVEIIDPDKITPVQKAEGKNHISGRVQRGRKTITVLDLDRVLKVVDPAELPVLQ